MAACAALAQPFAAAAQQTEEVPPPPAEVGTDAAPQAAGAAAEEEAEPTEAASQAEPVSPAIEPKGEDEVAEVIEGLTRSEDEVFEQAAQTRTGAVVLTEEEQSTFLQGSFTNSIRFATADEKFAIQPYAWVQPMLKLHITPDSNGELLESSGFELQRARFGFSSTIFRSVTICLLVGAKTGDARLEEYSVDIHPFGEEIALRWAISEHISAASSSCRPGSCR